MVSCSVLTSEKDVDDLADAWRALQARVGKVPFTDYDWAMTWWRVIGKPSGALLKVVVCYDKGQLVGILPLTVRCNHRFCILHLLGHDVYYYRSFLIDNPRYVEALWRTALTQIDYDFANIKNIHDETPERAFFERNTICLQRARIYYRPLTEKSRDEVLAHYPKSFRRKIKKVQQIIQADPTLSLRVAQGGEDTVRVIDFLVRRKQAWVKQNCKRGFFLGKNTLTFYQEMAQLAAAQGRLLLHWIEEEGVPIAADLAFTYGGVVYSHTLAYAPAKSRLLPGYSLNMAGLLWGVENGQSEFNLMEGEEDYKTYFTRETRGVNEYVHARTLAGRVYLWLYWLLRGFRALSERLRCLRPPKS